MRMGNKCNEWEQKGRNKKRNKKGENNGKKIVK